MLRHFLQRRFDLGSPGVDVFGVVALEGVLVLGVALPPTGRNILHRLQEEPRARHLVELAAQPADDLKDGDLALGQGLQNDKDEPGIGLAATGKADDVRDRGILADDVDEPRQLFLHQLERDALIGLDAADHPPGVLLREKALGDDREQVARESDRHCQAQHHQRRPLQRPAQRAVIGAEHCVEGALAGAIEAPVPLPAGC